jgi:hypothetical protein
MASYMQNWWRKHDMDRDGKGCALIAMFGCCGVFAIGVSFGCFLIWSIFL